MAMRLMFVTDEMIEEGQDVATVNELVNFTIAGTIYLLLADSGCIGQ